MREEKIKGYHLKGKQPHQLVIKELYPHPHKAQPTCFCSHFGVWKGPQPYFSTCSRLGSRQLLREAGMCQSHRGRDCTGQLAVPEPPAAFLGWQLEDCWFMLCQEEITRQDLLSPTLPGPDGIQLRTQHTSITP